MKISWRYLLVFVAMALLLGLALVRQAIIITYLVEPLARIVWLVVRLFLMIDQQVYWVLLIFAAFTFALRAVPGRKETTLRPAQSGAPNPEDRVASWQALLRAAEEDADARLALQSNLESLSSTIDTLVEKDAHEAVNLPPVKTAFWRRPAGRLGKSFLKRFFTGRAYPPDRDLERKIDQVLHSLEKKIGDEV